MFLVRHEKNFMHKLQKLVAQPSESLVQSIGSDYQITDISHLTIDIATRLEEKIFR